MRRRICLPLLALAVAGCLGGPAPGPDGETPTAPTLPPVDADAPLRFTLNASYVQGETADVAVRNEGNASYAYNPYYQACFLAYEDASGRRFRIPPGTHCDMVAYEEIPPGSTAHLFWWQLDECVVDRWGCAERRLLPPGEYRIQGTFHEWTGEGVPGEDGVTIEARFRIVAAPGK